MRYLDEYRDPKLARLLALSIQETVTRPWTVMEICGGHTHAIMRFSLADALPPLLKLVHGPGCPVCVTPAPYIDRAVELAMDPKVMVASFGDMLRVPGSGEDLLTARSRGGDVRVVDSPLGALALAREHPDREVVFFAVGFETTAPANAMAVLQAEREGVRNFSELASQVLVAPAIEFLLAQPDNEIQGFLAPGHVCTVMGHQMFADLAAQFKVPLVVAGFEPVDILAGLLELVRQLEAGGSEVVNRYRRSVSREGNPAARAAMDRVFEPVDREWRGVGVIPKSGLGFRKAYQEFDAEHRFGRVTEGNKTAGRCAAGEVLTGRISPPECVAFGRECTPLTPLGAPMVSSEGACAAYFRYGRGKVREEGWS